MSEIQVYDQGMAIMPVVNVQVALQRYQDMKEFISAALHKDVDYGIIPGTNKSTLLKPGAEKLTFFFGLRPNFEDIEHIEDWTGHDHNDEPFFYYRVKCSLFHGGQMVASADGSCNSWEKKYRWRDQGRKCPNCKKETIIKGKQEYGGGWLCFAKKGGCGAKFQDGDTAIESQSTEQIKNPDVAELVNTILKMAQKRALIAAVLIGANASEWFTQDIEDFTDGTFYDAPHVHEETLSQPAPSKLWDESVLDALAQNWSLAKPRLMATLKFCNLPKSSTLEIMSVWMTSYKSARDQGEEPAIAANSANEAMIAQPS